MLSSAVGRHRDKKQARILSALSAADGNKILTSQGPEALHGENPRICSTYTVSFLQVFDPCRQKVFIVVRKENKKPGGY